MARNVFGGGPEASTESSGNLRPEESAPRRRVPLAARGATSQKYIGPSTEGQAARTYQKIQLDQISASKARDRLSVDADIDELVESIRKDGQQIPITVRIVNAEQPYEIVVGRRRLAAMRRLAAAGELEENTINAFVRKMDDEQAIIAQWIENNQRVNPSFIERALFIAEIEKAGFKPKRIQEAIGVDDSLIRKMRAIVAAIPEPLLTAIGPAPEAGRRKWEELRQVCHDMGAEKAAGLAVMVDSSLPSSERLSRLITSAKSRPPAQTRPPQALAGGRLAAKRSGSTLNLKVTTTADQEFFSFLEERLADLYREWKGE